MPLLLAIVTPEGARSTPTRAAHARALEHVDEAGLQLSIAFFCAEVRDRIHAGEFDGGALYLMGSRRAVLIATLNDGGIGLRPGFGGDVVALLDAELAAGRN